MPLTKRKRKLQTPCRPLKSTATTDETIIGNFLSGAEIIKSAHNECNIYNIYKNMGPQILFTYKNSSSVRIRNVYIKINMSAFPLYALYTQTHTCSEVYLIFGSFQNQITFLL